MKDSERSILHLNSARTAFYFPEWIKDKLDFEDIQPFFDVPFSINDEDEEDDTGLVPDARALFTAAKTYHKRHLMSWKDLDIDELLEGRGVNGGSAGKKFRRSLVGPWKERGLR